MVKRNALLAFLVAVCFAQLVAAGTNYVGQVLQDVNVKNVGGTAVSTGKGAIDTGTMRVTLADGTSVYAGITGSTFAVTGLSGGPVVVDGSGVTQPVSAASLPLPSGAATSANQTNGNQQTQVVGNGNTAWVSAGHAQLVDGSGVTQPVSAAALPLPSGAATSANQTNGTQQSQLVGNGNVAWVSAGHAQIVDGSASTQPISASALPLPAGAATSALQTTGNNSLSSIDGKLPTLGQHAGTGSVSVVVASDQNLPVYPSPSATPTVSTTAVTTSDMEFLPANATRITLECETSCSNNKKVYLNFGAAATSNKKPMEPCTSWSPPPSVRLVSSLHVISESGTQAIICIEY